MVISLDDLNDICEPEDEEYYFSTSFTTDLRELADLCDEEELKDIPPLFQFYLYKAADAIEYLSVGRRSR